nr:PAB-dependent poly(A)-specific ribonuclease subunit 3 [Polyrhizophydium stewartii]
MPAALHRLRRPAAGPDPPVAVFGPQQIDGPVYDQSAYSDDYGYAFYDPQPAYNGMHMVQGGIESMAIAGSEQMSLQHHLYNSTLPHVANIPPNQKQVHCLFIEDHLRVHLQSRNEAIQQALDPTSAEGARLPARVDAYHTLFPLDESRAPSKIFGYPTSVYKAVRSTDGRTYVLRRIEGFRLTNEASMSCIEVWRRVRHAGCVSVVGAFTTKAFGDSSLVIVYDYHPLSTTLMAKYFARADPQTANGINERVLWSFICQIASAIKMIHAHNLAVRVVEPSKILITGKNRFRINCCSVLDMLTFDTPTNVQAMQQDDLFNFGKLIVALTSGSLYALHNMQKCMDHMGRSYSPDVRTLAVYLLNRTLTNRNIDDVIKLIAPRMLQEINGAFQQNDFLEDQLSRELENSRLVRLLCKLGFINERPEYELDPTCAETGDIYLLKLFRDYVFHQVDEGGAPILDLAHVLQSLNKLDVGVNEKIMLSSRDEQSCLIVSYRELKQCIETVFNDLMNRRGRIA